MAVSFGCKPITLLRLLCLIGALQCRAFTSTKSPLRRFTAHSLQERSRYSQPQHIRTFPILRSSTDDDDDDDADADADADDRIDLKLDKRLYKIRLSRAGGIDWGTDLSFSFVYVRAMDPAMPAALSGQITVGDQLCELQAVTDDPEPPVNLLGAPFDFAMSAFASLQKSVTDVDLVFFRGTKEELKEACSGEGSKPDQETVTITVIQNKGAKDEVVRQLQAPAGVNVRGLLVDNGINVYQSVTRWTNCKGKQLCGTCIVNIADGPGNTNRKSMDEDSTLRENPDSYRLSCVTFAYGDVTVETFPAIKPAQWTR
jgi:ferredoxin